MATAHAVSGVGGTSKRSAGDLIARISAKVRRLLSPNWALFRSGKTTDELIVAHHGPVEIRRTLAGWSLETCVRGEPDRARATALRRLSNYVNGKNRGSTLLCAARPLVQTEVSMCRWRISVAVPNVDSDFVAASGRNGRVRLRAIGSETVAVIRVPGRPTKLAIQHAETAIRHAIAPTGWEPSGGAMLRLHALPVVLPFLSRFEVAVPVVERPYGSVMPDWMRSVVFSGATAHEGVTQSGPPVR